jgi:hypothetical protein
MSGTLFKNDKGDNDKRPDYRGDCLIDGSKYEVSGWVKSGAKGKFLSLSFKPASERQPQRRDSRPQVDDDSDVPF